MFRKPIKRKEQATRQRADAPIEDQDEDSTTVVKDSVKRRRRENPMAQSTKRREQKETTGDSSSSSDDEVVNEHAFAASGSDAPLGPTDRGATFVSEHDTAREADAHSQFERVQAQLKEGLEKDGKTLYKGMAMYGAKEAKDTAKGNAANGLNRLGPMRAPQFLRQTVRWDYAPDICKDYKETGFCTFGDSCKFLHDRGDYKHGWEIERDYLAGNLNEVDDTNYEIPEEDGDGLPEECFICGNPFEDPVVTSCKHYFCSSCAVAAFKKSKRCKICNENTGGIFNVAKDIIAKMKRMKEEAEKEPSEHSDDEDAEKEIKQEAVDEHEHGEGCSHSHHHHDVKQEEEEEGEDQEDEEGDEQQEDEEVVDTEEQEAVDINMEEIDEDQGEVENSSEFDDEEDDEETKTEEKP